MTKAYASCTDAVRLYQGEILSNVIERSATFIGPAADAFGMDELVHPYAVIVTQDCDLEQDARGRATAPSQNPAEEKKRQNSMSRFVTLVVASEFEKSADAFAGSDVRKRAKQNKDERFQFLAPVPVADDKGGLGIPALVLDFKRVFAYRLDELLKAIERDETKRRARLVSPYAEHLSDRFAYFVQRIGLPRDHHDFEPQKAPPAPATQPIPTEQAAPTAEDANSNQVKQLPTGDLPAGEKK